MNLHALNYIIEIERCGSISKAAEQLHLSQPYLSKLVKELENEFQISLFTRSKQGVALTESGRVFLDMSKDLQKSIDGFHRTFRSHLEYEQLRVSSRTCTHPFDTFVRMLQDMGEEKLRCVFRETTNDSVISDVYTNAADIGILLLDQGNWRDVQRILEIKHIACQNLCASKGYLLARKGHPLFAARRPISMEDLYAHNFVVYNPYGESQGYLTNNSYLDDTIRLMDWDRVRQVVYITSRAALHDILLRTDYLSFGLVDVQDQDTNMGLSTHPLPPELVPARPDSGYFFCYIYLKNRELSPICRRFIHYLKRYYGDISEVPFPLPCGE